MSLLIAVGGYGLSRQPSSLRPFPSVNSNAVAGVEPEQRETRIAGDMISFDDLASIDTLDDIDDHRAR